ncbi:glyoxal oxidase N-terminus-domain-containing protein [Halteromyces radiatus]|uniref:glyoxal oxidase N-terminus-domain-containing protein n=1 Tax=Halteromyces radiatus TaxID=101107 RepID=UPI00221FF8F5|nr:glyoxal oxidase N-terminus-domain-containing protein [Halteromyces radiatus]KAI8098803.1 glyoxal oxidase N-terminus-domain-containing protein [Halteromyces radiatus]
MKRLTFLSYLYIISVHAQLFDDNPFLHTEIHTASPFAETGTMIQTGRTGVTAMHATLLNENNILIIDKAEWNEAQLDSGISAYSCEYHIDTNTYRTLALKTNTFCSAGGFLGNGTMISTGGAEGVGKWGLKAKKGHQAVRHFEPCDDNTCEWQEYAINRMTSDRWYPTVEQLPTGDIFIIGGSTVGTKVNRDEINVPSYEFWPPRQQGQVHFPFLEKATMPFNLYPFVFLLPDGHLFIFANTKSIIFDYENNKIVKHLPDMPGVPRSYPLTGGAVMLPLDPANNYNAEILVCGGSERMNTNSRADDTCGRINLGDDEPIWEMDTFVYPRLMPDGVLLADGSVAWVNGCKRGWAGYKQRNHVPTFDPVIYHPEQPLHSRWQTGLANTTIARMYHSVALTLPDGRVWIAGSNNNDPPDINAEYPTEFRVEYFSPPYLYQATPPRPLVSHVPSRMAYGESYEFLLNAGSNIKSDDIKVGLLRTGFSTHSLHMSQRYVVLEHTLLHQGQVIRVQAPPKATLFPPGTGFLHVVHQGVPSKGVQINVQPSR